MFEFDVHVTGWGILATIGGAVLLVGLGCLLRLLWVIVFWGKG